MIKITQEVKIQVSEGNIVKATYIMITRLFGIQIKYKEDVNVWARETK